MANNNYIFNTIYVTSGYVAKNLISSDVRLSISATPDKDCLSVTVAKNHGNLIAEFAVRGGEYFLIRGGWWKDTRGLSWIDSIHAVNAGEVRPGLNKQEFERFQSEFTRPGDWVDTLTELDKLAITWKRYRGTPECSIAKEARYI